MDKAARAVRRSSAKLMSLGGGHADLHVLLSEVKDMRNTAKAFMNAQNTVSQDFLKWAVNEENRAMQDVANQLAELNLLWTEVQREFGEHLKDYRHMFEMILEGERHVAQSKNNCAACEQREMKVRKELKKAFKTASPTVVQSLEGRLSQAERAKDLAQIEVVDRIRENEAVKLIRLKEGLLKLSKAYSDFAKKCAIVFDAQQDIVQQLPDVLDQDLEDMKYTGSGATRYRVQQAKETVRGLHRNREAKTIHWAAVDEPPPPYTQAIDMSSPIPTTETCNLDTPRTHSSPRRRTSEPLPRRPPPSHLHQYHSAVPILTSPEAPADSITLGPPGNISPSSSSTPPPPSLDPPPPPRPHSQPSSSSAPASILPAPGSTPSLYPVLDGPVMAPLPTIPLVGRRNSLPPPAAAAPPPTTVSPHQQQQHLQQHQQQDAPPDNKPSQVVDQGLVDFNPDWDNSYEDDISGAMGGLNL